MIPRVLGRLVGIALVGLSPAVLRAGTPPWLMEVIRQAAPDLSGDVPAAVLLNDVVVTVSDDYQTTTRHRRVIRILNRSGVQSAVAIVPFLQKTDSVSGCTAWLIRGEKTVKTMAKGDCVDIQAADAGTIYSDYRSLVATMTGEAIVGDVFAFETVVESPMLFLQICSEASDSLPRAVDRFQLQVPAGWSVAPFLGGRIAPVATVSADGRVFGWELRNRPYRPNETAVPPRERIDATVMATLTPARRTKKTPPSFASWAEMLAWKNQLNAGRCDSDPALAATVQKLTAGCADNIAKIRALARHVQGLRYVEVAKGIGIGFGYRVRKATEVHAKGWGDCKDKANLLQAMLGQAGIAAYQVYAQADRGSDVLPEWPSPRQFNHAITAIAVDAAVDLPAVVTTPRWGRLLIFDPTDPDTVVGDLPYALQGSKVLIDAPGCSELTGLPELPAESELQLERQVTLALSPAGTVSGRCTIGGAGQVGAVRRGWLRTTAAQDLRKKAVERLSETLRGVTVATVTSADDRDSGRCTVTFEFSAPRFMQLLTDGTALVRLDVLSRDSVPTFSARERRMPVDLEGGIQRDDVVLQLPKAFAAEELPAKTVLSGPYGAYECSVVASGQTVTRHRVLRLARTTVPVEKYGELQKFLSDVARADRTAIVLRRAE